MLSDRIPSRADIRLIRSLGQKKFREELGLFVAEGEKMVGEALTQKRFPVEAVYRLSDVGKEVMGRMSHLSSPSPALAVLRIPQEVMQDNAPAPSLPSGLCLGLDSVRDPGNAGTILRLADWFGIGTVYLSPDCVDLYNPKTVQATMGSIFRQRAVTCDLHALVRGCTAAGAALDTTRALILMGSERDGLSPALMSAATSRLHIPSFASNPDGAAESLNVAIATAVTCYEFRRR